MDGWWTFKLYQTLHGTAVYANIGVVWGVNVGIYSIITWSVWDRCMVSRKLLFSDMPDICVFRPDIGVALGLTPTLTQKTLVKPKAPTCFHHLAHIGTLLIGLR